MAVAQYLAVNRVVFLTATSKLDAFEELADCIANDVPGVDKAGILDQIWKRENFLSTRVSAGVAIPHAILEHVAASVVAVGISRDGIPYEDTHDDFPIHVLVMLVCNDSEHLAVLSDIAGTLSAPGVYDAVVKATDVEAAFRLISPPVEAPTVAAAGGGEKPLDVPPGFGNAQIRRLAVLRPSDVHQTVLYRALQVAVGVASEVGATAAGDEEMRPDGSTALIVVGDAVRVESFARPIVINPFRGYPESERNILDPSLENTIREYSRMDGALIVRGDGVVLSAGTFLRVPASLLGNRTPSPIPTIARTAEGRARTAGLITTVSQSIAFVADRASRRVQVYRSGRLRLQLSA